VNKNFTVSFQVKILFLIIFFSHFSLIIPSFFPNNSKFFVVRISLYWFKLIKISNYQNSAGSSNYNLLFHKDLIWKNKHRFRILLNTMLLRYQKLWINRPRFLFHAKKMHVTKVHVFKPRKKQLIYLLFPSQSWHEGTFSISRLFTPLLCSTNYHQRSFKADRKQHHWQTNDSRLFLAKYVMFCIKVLYWEKISQPFKATIRYLFNSQNKRHAQWKKPVNNRKHIKLHIILVKENDYWF